MLLYDDMCDASSVGYSGCARCAAKSKQGVCAESVVNLVVQYAHNTIISK